MINDGALLNLRMSKSCHLFAKGFPVSENIQEQEGGDRQLTPPTVPLRSRVRGLRVGIED